MPDLATLSNVIRLLDVIIIIGIVCFRKRNPLSSMAWIMFLFLSPVIGGTAFLIFGVGLDSYSRYRYKKKLELNESLVLSRQKEYASAQKNQDIPTAGLIKYLLNSDCIYSENNDVKIFTDAGEKYEALIRDIENARESINMLYFIIRNDSVGNRVIDALCKKAREGVKVRLMYDGFGSILTPRRLFDRLREIPGSEVEEFFPVRILSFSKINHRNHRKIAIIDDEIAYLGGMNIGDEYMRCGKRSYMNWRDTHLRIVGSAVSQINGCFAQDWKFSTKREFPVKPASEEAAGDVDMQIVASGPDTADEEIKCGMIRMIYGAKKYIKIQTPYFVPDEPFLSAIKTAAKSGVDVQVMIPGIPDKKYVYHTTMSYVGELLDAGVKVLLYPGFIHSKTITVDDEIATVGSANTDIRSFSLLFEINAFLYGKKIAGECREIFDADEKECRILNLEEYKMRGIINIVKEGFFRLFSPIM